MVRPEGWCWLYLPKSIRKAKWQQEERVEWHNDYGIVEAVPMLIVTWSILIPWLGPMVVICSQLFAAIIVVHCGYKPLLSWLIDKRVSEDRCGGCKYTLIAIPIEPDGRRVCPECGAAWGARGGASTIHRCLSPRRLATDSPSRTRPTPTTS